MGLVRRSVFLAMVVAVAGTGTASGQLSTSPVTVSGVTQYFSVYYNSQVCQPGTAEAGNDVWQIYNVQFRWYRNSTTDRFVYNARYRANETGAVDCSGNNRTDYYHDVLGFLPCWGTGCASGSTSPNWTKTYSYSYAWPYMGATFIAGSENIGVILKSRVEDRTHTLGYPCSRVNLSSMFTCSDV